MKFSGDPHDAAIGELIPNPVAAADSQVDFSFNAGDRFRPPPLFQLFRFGPSREQALRGSRDDFSYDKIHRCDRRVTAVENFKTWLSTQSFAVQALHVTC